MKFDKRLLAIFAVSVLLFGALAGGVLLTSNPGTASAAQAGADGENEADDGNEGPDVPITGDALEKASAAALNFLGGGRVTETEVGDEEGYYEIEVTLDDGSQVDVHLDEAFNILGKEGDGPGADD